MSTSSGATERYQDGSYGRQHPGWHLEDARAKATDLTPGLSELVRRFNGPRLRVAEIGAGVGGVLVESVNVLHHLAPNLTVAPTGFDISPQAVESARQMFSELEMHCKLFEAEDGPFDAVLLVDVLEHLENPWDILRTAREASEYLLIRQPLLDNFCTFRHNHYSYQREHWGHIMFFTVRSLLDMAQACGWKLRSEISGSLGIGRQSRETGYSASSLLQIQQGLGIVFYEWVLFKWLVPACVKPEMSKEVFVSTVIAPNRGRGGALGGASAPHPGERGSAAHRAGSWQPVERPHKLLAKRNLRQKH